ncbi:MAG: DPP IV N-terminal domain-containing protein, partial [Paludibacteraceae bacterium]|nr:DPP IV N-terminal domain-containing protein [Paludibacteraceae bacterium]
MKRLYIALSALMAFSAVNAQRNNSVIKDIAEKKYAACPFAGIVPMADGESYAQLSADGRTVVQYEYKSGKAVATLFDASKARGASLSKIDGFQFDPQNKNMFVYNKSVKPFRRVPLAKYYTFDIQRNKLHALIDSACLQRDPVYSPNGRSIVFSVDNDLYLKKMDYDGIVMRMTRNGDSAKYNGVSDWLYEEEFSAR